MKISYPVLVGAFLCCTGFGYALGVKTTPESPTHEIHYRIEENAAKLDEIREQRDARPPQEARSIPLPHECYQPENFHEPMCAIYY